MVNHSCVGSFSPSMKPVNGRIGSVNENVVVVVDLYAGDMLFVR